jgi:hypothetical protein
VGWTIINAVCLVAPFILVWGWVLYARLPTRSGWRSHASFLGLLAPALSVVIGTVSLMSARSTVGRDSVTPAARHLPHIAVWLPIAGIVLGIAGRPRLMLAIVPACIGTVLFWYGVTLP